MTSPWAWVKQLFGAEPTCPQCHAAVRKAEASCTVCGYDLVTQARITGGGPRPPV